MSRKSEQKILPFIVEDDSPLVDDNKNKDVDDDVTILDTKIS